MQWVFIALLFVIVSILVLVLQRVMAAVKNSLYIPPSEAVIDQSMPQEILEHIFSFMDPLTLLQSHNVNKYWRSHSSKNRIKLAVLERYVNSIKQELPDIKYYWMEYDENYPIDRRLSDIALAQKRGRDLIELHATDFYLEEEMPILKGGMDSSWGSRFIIKSLTRMAFNSPYRFELGRKYITVINGSKELESTFTSTYGQWDLTVNYEVMVNLEDFCTSDTHINLIMCRNTNETKRFGIIPLDRSFLPTMIFLIIPLIVHDAIYSEPFMNILKQWFGPIAFLVMNALLTQENLGMLRHYTTRRNLGLYRKLLISTSIASIIAFILFLPISSTHFAFLGIFVSACLYGFALYDHCFSEPWYIPKSKEKLQLFLICVALVLLMNDWSMTIQSFIDGAIWSRLFWNMIHYLIFAIYAMWINIMYLILQNYTEVWNWSYLVKVDRDSVNLMAVFCCSAVFVTLYAPYWRSNQ